MEPGTIGHLWFNPLKTHKTPSAAEVKRTAFTLYFSSSYSKKYKVRQIWISGENTRSAGAPHTHKDLKETLENTINDITQPDKYSGDKNQPLTASRSISRQLGAIAGETGSTGRRGRAAGSCRCGPSGSWLKMHFLLHIVCALLTDVNRTQPKFRSACIIIHRSDTARWQRVSPMAPPLCACLILT